MQQQRQRADGAEQGAGRNGVAQGIGASPERRAREFDFKGRQLGFGQPREFARRHQLGLQRNALGPLRERGSRALCKLHRKIAFAGLQKAFFAEQ